MKPYHSPSFSSVQFSLSLSDSLPPHRLQHARLPCPSPTPRAYSNSRSSIRWCHPTISFSIVPFFLPSIFPSIRVFSNESVFRIRWASASVLPVNIQDWFPLGLTGSPCSSKNSQVPSPTPQFKSINSSALSFLYSLTLTFTQKICLPETSECDLTWNKGLCSII